MENTFIERPYYLDWLLRWKDHDVIKVLTGVRRCGKSTLLRMLAQKLRANEDVNTKIVEINLEEIENESLKEYRALHDAVMTQIGKAKHAYVFIDEIQLVKDFEKAVDSLYVKPNIDLYITGSNAVMLSGSLTTLLSGRYVELNVLPLSFSEFVGALVSSNELAALAQSDLQVMFENYLRWGAFPAVLNLQNNGKLIYEYLQGILSTVLLKDVSKRKELTNTMQLEALTTFLFSAIGSPISPKKIADTLTSMGQKVSQPTVAGMLQSLCDGYLFYPVQRFDIKGKVVLRLIQKYYTVDLGLRGLMIANTRQDRGHILENIVFLELKRRFGKLYVGKSGSYEVDFVAKKQDGLAYYQVSQTVQEDSTLDRELHSLKLIADNEPKYLLTEDVGQATNFDGITQINLQRWLLGLN